MKDQALRKRPDLNQSFDSTRLTGTGMNLDLEYLKGSKMSDFKKSDLSNTN